MLTDTQIRKLKAPEKATKLSDERGLYLLVTPTGSRLWRLKYRFAGKEKLLSLGAYPDVSLSGAREARDDARRLLAQGIDPSANKQREKRALAVAAANSFEKVAREWLENVRAKWASVTHGDTIRRFEKYVFPDIGHRPISEIDPPELLVMLRKIEARGIVFSAHKISNSCGQVFRYGIQTGRCARNPAADLRGALKARPAAKPMASISPAELPDLLERIELYDGEEQTRLAVQLMALTFVRTTELRAAEWREFDLEKREWTIPGLRMKGKKPHHVPLSIQAVAILRRLREMNAKWPWVFPGRAPIKPVSKNTILFALYRMGLHSRMTGHGFRALASTILNEQGYRPDVIERQLAHTEKNDVRAAYHRSQYLEERTQMMQDWADYIDRQRLPSISSGAPLPVPGAETCTLSA